MNLPTSAGNIKAEESIIALMLADHASMEHGISELTASHFDDRNLQAIFVTMRQQFKKIGHTDVVTIDPEITDIQRDRIRDIMMLAYHSDFGKYFRVLEEFRRIRESAIEIKRVFETMETSENLVQLGEKLMLLGNRAGDYPEYSMRELAERATARWEKKEITRKTYHLGIPIVDDLLKIKAGNMVYIVAPPKTGKTWLLAIIAQFLAIGNKVLFISAEMHPDDLFTRIGSHIAGKDLSALDYMANLNTSTLEAFNQKIMEIIERNISFVKARGIPFGQLKNKIKIAINRGVDVIIIDYLQRIKHENQDQRIATLLMSRELADMAGKHEKLFICASQAGRAARTAEYTQAHHAKESSSIEEDADIVLSLTNKTDYTTQKKGEPYDLAIDVFQRNGFAGLVKLKFDPTTGQYFDPNQTDFGKEYWQND